MPSISLKVMRPPSKDASEAIPDSAKPLFRGTGETDYLCGNCGAIIALGIGPTQRVPFHSATCSACGAENEFPPSLGS